MLGKIDTVLWYKFGARITKCELAEGKVGQGDPYGSIGDIRLTVSVAEDMDGYPII